MNKKSINTESTFQQDTTDLNFLHAELSRMTEKIAFQLRCDNRLTGCVSVKIRYTDFETHNIQKTIPPPTRITPCLKPSANSSPNSTPAASSSA